MSAGPKPMTDPRHGSGLALTPRYPLARGAASLSRVEVRWSVSRRSLGIHAPEGVSRMVELTIALSVGAASGQAVVTVTDPASGRSAVLRTLEAPGVELIDDIRSETHIEAPGLLHATVAPDATGQWRLLYARTPLLAELAIPGGRSEPAGVRVEP